MNKEQIETAAEQFKEWNNRAFFPTRLQRHEAMKAILFNVQEPYAVLEYPIEKYDGKRKGLIDYVDYESAIEIDDGPSVKSLRKLDYIRRRDNISVFWILIISVGKGGKARRLAETYEIPTLRILARNTGFTYIEWL